MDVLLVGSGGREHALAWKLAQSGELGRLLIAPGNPGTAAYGTNVAVEVSDVSGLVALARQERVALVVVGPEAPLAAGLADACRAAGIAVFGPSAAAARIESSKRFAKELMDTAGIPTAGFCSFHQPADAAAFVRANGKPWVVKADGLAAGKGVIVAADVDATLAAIAELARTSAGKTIVLEEVLSGPEVSLLALCDGRVAVPLLAAQDHKRLLDGDHGPNTGGMGAFAPSPLLPPVDAAKLLDLAIKPALEVLAQRGSPFSGVLYCGLMLTPEGPRVLEFNARFGDPEAQPLMMLFEGDLLQTLHACSLGSLRSDMVGWKPGAAACVVLAAAGYPGQARSGDPISGLDLAEQSETQVFHAGTSLREGQLVTAGGRVLGVTAYGASLDAALERAYARAASIHFEGMQYRRDIGAALRAEG